MNIRNLVNKDSVTITNCESEPIHIPGSIQPHGFLLGINKEDLRIIYCSENCTVFLNKPLTEILGQPLISFFEEEDVSSFKAFYSRPEEELSNPFVFTLKGKSYNATGYVANNCVVLEFELFNEQKVELPDMYIQTKRFAYYTERADNLKSLCKDIADETRLITGYDRVMIYKFDKDYNGVVFAESIKEDMEPFLELTYPHTDIPAQARELFIRNHVRMITDVNYTPCPLYTYDNGTITPTLDLSISTLRSSSPIHIEYLKNMGVGASFTISLIHNKKLWGLIACHHNQPKHIPYYTRLAAHLQGIFLSSQIDVRQVADEFEHSKATDQKFNELHEILLNDESSIVEEKNLTLLKNLLNADGVIFCYKDDFFTQGMLPQQSKIEDLVSWILANVQKGIYTTSRLADQYSQAETMSDTIAGVFYISLGRDTKDCIIWTRRSVEKTINWAGDPNKAMVINTENKSLTPRNSFKIWKESVKFQSPEWLKAETNAAAAISASIQNQLHIANLRGEQLRYRSLNEKMQRATDELANMNWISTHDLKEPLRKIQMYASVILEKEGTEIPEGVKTTISRMQLSAGRMQELIEDLLSYTKIAGEKTALVDINLNDIITEVQIELEENIEKTGAQIQSGNLPVIQGLPFQIRQLFINLVSNAIKFAQPALPPAIAISCATLNSRETNFGNEKGFKNYYKITVADNGIGFDNQYKEGIFKIFQRLNASQYNGTGIGLAICKKIAEAHDGFIEATGVEGKGSQFSVYFPKQNS